MTSETRNHDPLSARAAFEFEMRRLCSVAVEQQGATGLSPPGRSLLAHF